MAIKRDPDPELRVPLSKDRVLEAAVAFADREGIDALTMRKLASELGFEVMSLYNHVANKDDILDGMVDLVASEIDFPPADQEWKAAMRFSAVSAHQALLRHPWAGPLWSSRWPGPARIEYMEATLRGLREAGFSAELTHYGYHALSLHIVGFTIQVLSFPIDPDDLGEVADNFLQAIDVERFPYLVEHVREHLNDTDHEDGFVFALNLILDGLEQIRDASS